MKNIFKIAVVAVASLSLLAACKNGTKAPVEEAPIDTTPIEEIVEDTLPAIDTVEVAPVEEPVKKATTKTTTKKATEQKEAVTKTATEDGKTIMTVNTGKAKPARENKTTGEEAKNAMLKL